MRATPHDAAAPIPACAGIGLRARHHDELAARLREHGVALPAWLEVHAENYLLHRPDRDHLVAVARRLPLSLHGVGLSLGSAEGLDRRHLRALRELISESRAALVSEHLAWNAAGGQHLPDLLPLPYDESTLDTLTDNINTAQDALGRRLLIENPSRCFAYRHSTMPEALFAAMLVHRTGCGLLLDVNNVFVTVRNLGGDFLHELRLWLATVPHDAIGEIHLAGHASLRMQDGTMLLIDDHGSSPTKEVIDGYALVVETIGSRPALIEWDTDVPRLDVLLAEAARIDRAAASVPLRGRVARHSPLHAHA